MKTSVKGVTRFSVSLPPSLVKDFDEAWKGLGYNNRSKAAHDAFRSFISELKWTKEQAEDIAGAIVLLYYVDKPGLLNEIVRLQHKFQKVVSSTMHIHLTKDKCLEIIAVKGKANDIKSLSQELMTKKCVKQLKFTTIAL
jgi:CopG family nickel-responsive transcriptional regulator